MSAFSIKNSIHLVTKRLILRQWKERDYVPFSIMNSDACMMKYFQKSLTRMESDVLAEKIQSFIEENDWGLWVVELKSTHEFIGFVGLNKPKPNLPPWPCVEIGWRLAKNHWGRGYATEAAKQALNYAFNTLVLNEVVAFTIRHNRGSLAIMNHLGMTNTGLNILHSDIDPSSFLCEHVLYKITKSQGGDKSWPV